MTDIAGNEIREGSLIVYATSVGDSPALLWGRVVRTKPVSGRVHSTSVENRITIQGLDRWWAPASMQLRDRLTTLSYPSRIVVISWAGPIPQEIRRLLDPDGSYTYEATRFAGLKG